MRARVYLILVAFNPIFWIGFSSAQKTNRAIDSLKEVLLTTVEDSNKVKTLNALSWESRNAGQTEKARAYTDTSIVLADRLQFKPGSATAYNMLGLLDMEKSDYISALRHYDLSLRINKEIGNKNGMSSNIGNMGLVYWAQSNYPAALDKFTAALQIAVERGDKQAMISIYNNIGTIYGAQGNYPEALEKFLATLKLAKETGNTFATAVSLKNVGSVYSYLGKHIEAEAYFKEHLRLMEELGNKEGIANAYDQIGITAERQGHHEEALQAFSDALKLFEEISRPYSVALVHNHIGSVHIGMANYPEALNSLRTALQIREEIGDKEGISESNGSIGRVYAKQAASLQENDAQDKYLESILYTNKSLTLAKEIGYTQGVKGMYKQLTEIYTSMGDYKNALEYNSLFIAIKDSLLNNESTRKLEQLRTQYEVETAVAKEKVKQDSLLSVQKFQSEKEQSEINARHALAIAEAQAQKQKAIAVAQVRYEMALAESKTEKEKQLAEQKFQSEIQLAEENSRHQLALADERATAEQQKAERVRRNQTIGASTLILALIGIFIYLLQRQRRLKRKAIEKAETIHKMAELELQSLRAQLNPHFMFNSLNAIQELILMEENDKSHTYLARFAKLLRMLLENANSPFIPLAREIEFLQLYLSLENLRIPDLKYKIEIDPGINTEQIRIPNMILQPYIENAIWHGLSHKQHGDRKIQIRVTNESMGVKYEIEDNGVGRKRAQELKSVYRKEHRSKGMELLTKRFKLINEEYRSHIETQVEDLEKNDQATGTKVAILVPWELARDIKKTA